MAPWVQPAAKRLGMPANWEPSLIDTAHFPWLALPNEGMGANGPQDLPLNGLGCLVMVVNGTAWWLGADAVDADQGEGDLQMAATRMTAQGLSRKWRRSVWAHGVASAGDVLWVPLWRADALRRGRHQGEGAGGHPSLPLREPLAVFGALPRGDGRDKDTLCGHPLRAASNAQQPHPCVPFPVGGVD